MGQRTRTSGAKSAPKKNHQKAQPRPSRSKDAVTIASSIDRTDSIADRIADLNAPAQRIEEKLMEYIVHQAEQLRATKTGTVVQARRFEVVDAKGRVCAVLGDRVANGGPGLDIIDASGASRITLNFFDVDEGQEGEDEDVGVGIRVESRDGRSIASVKVIGGHAYLDCQRDGEWEWGFPEDVVTVVDSIRTSTERGGFLGALSDKQATEQREALEDLGKARLHRDRK